MRVAPGGGRWTLSRGRRWASRAVPLRQRPGPSGLTSGSPPVLSTVAVRMTGVATGAATPILVPQGAGVSPLRSLSWSAAGARARDRVRHVLQRRVHVRVALERGVGVVLDGLGDRRVERRHRTRDRVLDRRAEGLQVGELLVQRRAVVEVLEHRSQRRLLEVRALGLLALEVLDEVQRRRLVVGVGADACTVTTERRGARLTGCVARERSDGELALHLRGLVVLGQAVDVRPVAEEEQ